MNKKSLAEWLEYLESIHPSEIDLGLDRVRCVASSLGLVRPAEKVLMVAGTNGKGSTVTYAASVLKRAGLTVGCYMSPHLHVYNERVQINGRQVSDEDLIESFEVIDKARGPVTLTYFEVGTLSALYLFKKYRVDVAVLEVGLGGRLDAVNLVEPDVSVVTSIGLDHQDWLGSDISVIAKEKAGIFRGNKPAICGQKDAPFTLNEYAHSIGAKLCQKGENFDLDEQVEGWVFKGLAADGGVRKIYGNEKPKLPLVNLSTAIQALVLLLPSLKDEDIVAGVSEARLAGRLQEFDKPFKGLLDVGHNGQAAQLLAGNMARKEKTGRRYCVLAMLNDKDALSVAEPLASHVDEWHLAGLSGYRGQTAESLSNKLQGRISEARCHESVANALNYIKSVCSPSDEVIVLGSFVTVAEAQDWLKG